MGDVQLPLSGNEPQQRRTLRSGAYITFEGPSCSGKDVQVARLSQFLREQGYPVLVTRQPGGTTIGQAIRQTLLHPELRAQFLPKTESLLYWADRHQHHETLVKPAVASGTIVLGSRDADSSFVYQSAAKGLSHEWMRAMETLVTESYKPHATILLLVDEARFIERTILRRERSAVDKGELRIEDGERALFNKIVAGYLALCEREPHRFIVIDGNQSTEAVERDIRAAIDTILRTIEEAE